MDVMQVLEEAVVTGTAAAAKDQASAVVTGAVSSLRELVRRVFGADPLAQTALEKLPEVSRAEADVWREQVRLALQKLPETEVRELLAQAQAVLALTEPGDAAAGRFQVTITMPGARGVQTNQGGSGHVQKNTF